MKKRVAQMIVSKRTIVKPGQLRIISELRPGAWQREVQNDDVVYIVDVCYSGLFEDSMKSIVMHKGAMKRWSVYWIEEHTDVFE